MIKVVAWDGSAGNGFFVGSTRANWGMTETENRSDFASSTSVM
ncbi:MAG: hypothetical protein ABIR33_06700 [Pyrinomonadaceae bacterium]